MIKRAFDIVFSVIGLTMLFPVLLVIALLILLSSKGSVFYKQKRVGRHSKFFSLFKFRTMIADADQSGLLTVGVQDKRITPIGKFLRKYKLDELPQLWNILIGDMSLVGPRPEVPQFVNHYSPEQLKVLEVRPGLTDYASLEFINENEILEKYSDPEKAYIDKIMPVKLDLNLKYIREQSFANDLIILTNTLSKIIRTTTH